ncbi:MAG: ATPase, T2SS/T4P/T4SS family [Candidatus Diapherotrites archaeon]
MDPRLRGKDPLAEKKEEKEDPKEKTYAPPKKNENDPNSARPRIREAKGPRIDSYQNVEIFDGFPHKFYEIKKKEFTPTEEKMIELIVDIIRKRISIDELSKNIKEKEVKNFVLELRDYIVKNLEFKGVLVKLSDQKTYLELKEKLLEIVDPLKFVKDKTLFCNEILARSIGYGKIDVLMDDGGLEEVMVNGFNRPIFVFHRQHGMCKTNLVSGGKEELEELILKIARTIGRQFNEKHPLLDARLPDGSRANATYDYATPFGHSLTIRKFTRIPVSIINLIENNTLTSHAAAFLWVMVEGMHVEPMNIIITGGASSGKTTLLDALSVFIRYSERIITIEDTLELDLGSRQNWIQMESKPKIKDTEEVSMDDLLKNALRMRPDRVIVGEVRGPEAQTLFAAMDIGHRGILGTLHSNTAKEMLVRLKSAPMNVPEMMLPLLDLIIVTKRVHHEEGINRRIAQIAEITHMENQVLLGNVFELDPKTERVKLTDVPSHTLETLADKTGLSKKDIKREIIVRKKILEWMIKKGMRRNHEVEETVQLYYRNPSKILTEVSDEISADNIDLIN